MPRSSILILAALVACASPDDDKKKNKPVPLPDVWGPVALDDVDPDPDVVEVHLNASKTRVSWLDGGKTQVWGYNDLVPGPLIQAQVGDLLRVVFTNDLPDPTTIHWHGLRVPSEMDGVPAVQDPVEPGEQFTYEFELPDAGSFWYHPHVRSHEQVERGLHGALVVHEAEPPAYDQERYFVLDDVLLDEDNQLWDPGLIAGMDGMHGRHGNVLLANGSADVLEDTVERGTRERWRIVNTANARTMFINVVGADWRVIAIDGTLLPEPFAGAERQVLPVGRRFDLEVVPKDAKSKVKLVVDIPASATTFDSFPVFEGSLVGDRPAPGFLALDAPALPALEAPTQEMQIALNARADQFLEWTINDAVYGEGTSIPVTGSTPTVIEISELSGAEHPFHLHGQFFQILDRDTGEAYPGLLDTILMAPFETATIQTDFSNPGVWMAHCHILEHAELGMMTEVHVSE